MKVSGSAVVVTGATSGIGAATAVALTEAGCAVAAVGRDEMALRRLADRTGAEPIAADVGDPRHAERVVATTLAKLGRLDGVVANAGIGHLGDFSTMPVDRIDQIVDVNVRAPMLLARSALPTLLDQRSGGLVFVSSIAGALPVKGETAYSLSKHAVEDFAETLRAEVGRRGVAVSVIRPGVARTAFFERRGQPYGRRWPRPIPAETVAAAIVDALATGQPIVTVPRWLELPALLRRRMPAAYRILSRNAG